MTQGMKSSEFWLIMGLAFMGIIGPKFGFEVPMEAFLGGGGYALARGLAKAKK